jgi:hypothetical protein
MSITATNIPAEVTRLKALPYTKPLRITSRAGLPKLLHATPA